MSEPDAGARLSALVSARADFPKLTGKEFDKAASVLIKKLLISGGQTVETISHLRRIIGSEVFTRELEALTDNQASKLARRLDRKVDTFEVATSGAAVAHILRLLEGTSAAPEAANDIAPAEADTMPEPAPEPTPEPEPEPEPVAASPAKSYFGRKSFRLD